MAGSAGKMGPLCIYDQTNSASPREFLFHVQYCKPSCPSWGMDRTIGQASFSAFSVCLFLIGRNTRNLSHLCDHRLAHNSRVLERYPV
jgi:hypothetical protein